MSGESDPLADWFHANIGKGVLGKPCETGCYGPVLTVLRKAMQEAVVGGIGAAIAGHRAGADDLRARLTVALSAASERIAALEAKVAECPTCAGSGAMSVLARVEPPDEREVYEGEMCAECRGTGISAWGQAERARDEAQAALAVAFARARAIALGCKDMGGGYSDDREREIFHHGMETVANALKARAEGRDGYGERVIEQIGRDALGARAEPAPCCSQGCPLCLGTAP